MKEITKHRLKQVNRLLKIALLTFCWLMACVGVTAYSVYWLRQNANYEQEVQKRVLKPKMASNDSFSLYFEPYTDINYYKQQRTTSSVSNFLLFDNNIITSQQVHIDLEVTNANFENIKFRVYFSRYTDGNLTQYFNFNLINFLTYRNNVVASSGNIFVYSTDYLNSYVWYFETSSINITEASSGVHITDYVSFLKFVFNVIYDSRYSTSFILDFSNPYLNFEQLLSYSRIGVYDFIKVGSPFGSTYEVPFDFIYDGVLYDAIIIDDIYVVQYINDEGQKVYYKDTSGGYTNYLMTCNAIYFREYGGSYTTDSTSSGVGYNTLVGDLLQVAYREIAYFEPSRLGSATATETIYPVWNMQKGYNTYGRISYNLSISNDSLNTIPFPNNDISSAHYPLNNLTIKEILSYVTSFNGDGFDNYGVDNDLGLGGVFTLVKGAFGGLVGLLAIQILPGLSLGLLLFVPLILTIIIVILRLVKK